MDSGSETTQDSDRMSRRRSRTEPTQRPVYKYSEEEMDQLVRETMITDSKVDACLDKFFASYVDALPPPPQSWYSWKQHVENPDTELESPGLGQQLRQELVRDVDTLLPDYYEKRGLASATVQEKFDRLRKRYQRRWDEFWKRLPFFEGQEQGEYYDEVLDKARLSLADKRARELSEASSSKGPSAGGATSLLETCTTAALRELQSAVEGERSTAIFAYGGSIEVVASDDAETATRPTPDVEMKDRQEHAEGQAERGKGTASDEEEDKEEETSDQDAAFPRQSSPVRIFWSSDSDNKEHKVALPCLTNDGAFEILVQDCTPASFGRGDKEVFDPEYRRAGKLDPTKFCTSFHPADFGILDSIKQMLLPGINSSQQDEMLVRGVRAELYKLNVYSGPSGHFKAHVDTPRSENQIGSLVVCLPSAHKGGALSVRHGGQVVDFNWSDLSSSHIQWAAFYSDCEHEIATVTSGHRLTLTYNLYVTASAGTTLLANPSLADHSSFPLYSQVKALLNQPSFFPAGSVLGFFCSHSYAHTTASVGREMPYLLKGSDMALFAVLKALGLDAEVRPVLEHNGEYFSKKDSGGFDVPNRISADAKHYLLTEYFDDASRAMESFREKGYMKKESHRVSKTKRTPFRLTYRYQTYDLEDCEDIHQRWKSILIGRYPAATKEFQRGAVVGCSVHPYVVVNRGGEDYSSEDVVASDWQHYALPDITWVTPPKDEKMALSHLCYGNESEIGHRYSCAAIIAVVPPISQRLAAAE